MALPLHGTTTAWDDCREGYLPRIIIAQGWPSGRIRFVQIPRAGVGIHRPIPFWDSYLIASARRPASILTESRNSIEQDLALTRVIPGCQPNGSSRLDFSEVFADLQGNERSDPRFGSTDSIALRQSSHFNFSLVAHL
jgi:hypothetical protein